MRYKIIVLTCIVLWGWVLVSGAQTLTAREILDRAETVMDLGRYHTKAQMTIETTGGDQRTLELEIWGEGTDKAFMKYTDPARIRGVTFLFYEEDIWSYFPSTGRTRHLASHIKNQKMMGSSFSYEDMTASYKEYQGEILKEEKIKDRVYYVIRGEQIEEDKAYDQIIAWIARDDFLPLKMDFYQQGEHVKTLEIESYMQVNSELKPERIKMKDILNDDETLFKYLELETVMDFRNDFFDKRMLERISRR